MTSKLFPFFAVLAFSMAGCAPQWTIKRQATPNPMVGKTTFGLSAINFRGLRVGEKTEQDYLEKKSEETRRKWVGDKFALNREFGDAFAEHAAEAGIEIADAGTGSFTIHPRVRWVEPGFNVGVAQKRSKVKMTLVIRDIEGNLVDEIKLKHRTEAYTIRDRLEGDGEALGEIAADYLAARVHPEDT